MPRRSTTSSNFGVSWSLVDVLSSTTAVLQMPIHSGNELWAGCARWFRDMNVLTDKDGSLMEFASVIRDGVLLCRLANTLVPNAIDTKDIIKGQQSSQFTCIKNITLFLDFCRSHFKFQEADLIAPGDLFHMTGFHKTLKILSVLSHSEEATSRGVAPFPEIDKNQQSTSHDTNFIDDEEIYQSLHDNIENIDPDQTIYGPITKTDPEEKQNEQVYDRIVTTRKPSTNDATIDPKKRLLSCINELYTTETNYVTQALFTIIKTFYESLKGIIPTEDYNTIFGNIEEIAEFHRHFLEDLKWPVDVATARVQEDKMPRPSTLSDRAPQTIGQVFIKYRDQFLAYGKYCSNLPESRKVTNELINNNPFISQNIQDLVAQGNHKFGMSDLLMVPFQRVMKYTLILKALQGHLKKVDMGSPDLDMMPEAIEVMEDVCNYINEEIRDVESKRMIDEIEKSITDLSMPTNVKLHDYGRVNHDGEVKIVETVQNQPGGKAKQRYVFLFDKVLVICKAATKNSTKDRSQGSSVRANTFTYKNAYVISELRIDKDVLFDAKFGGTITRKMQYVINMYRDRSETNEITNISFLFKNEASRSSWLNALLLSKSNVSPTEQLRDTNHKVSFTSFRVDVTTPHVCDVCQKLMKGLRYQGYKCEACNSIMHKDCLGLKRCEAIRRHDSRGSHSFNSNRSRLNVNEGDVVVANSSFTPSDLSYLQFAKGDRIEVIKMQGNNRFTGCLVNNRNRTGLVNLSHISHSRTSSMIGLSPLDSPAGTIAMRGITRNESTVLPQRSETMLSDGSGRGQPSRTSRNSSTSTINGVDAARQQDYINTEISEFLWYMGEMERTKAESTLRGTPNGTFLVRYSKNRKQTAISLSYKNDVKHMIIEEKGDGKVYLDEDYLFNSKVELVQYYREHNLIEIFQALDTCLRNPYSQFKMFKAVHDYDASAQNQDGKFLSLKTGDTVVLLDTVGEDRGWWKGAVNNRTGFFPLSYVRPYDPATESTPNAESPAE